MRKEGRLAISAGGLGAYSLLMFTAAGFFFSNYREMMDVCGRYSYADCSANESVYVSLVSLKIGTVVFCLLGVFAWSLAAYLGFSWARILGSVRLP